MKAFKITTAAAIAILAISGCVSKKKYNLQVTKADKLKDSLNFITNQLDQCLYDRRAQAGEIERLSEEVKQLKANASAMLNQLSDSL